MGSRKLLLVAAIVGFVPGLVSIANAQSQTYGLGKAATPDEVRAWDIAIGPDGKELPPGKGTAAQGAKLFMVKGCFTCHGQNGYNGPAPTLIKSDGKTKSPYACLVPCVNDSNVMALHAPYATTMWDYINRGMPLTQQGTLKPDEVYSLVAFILFKNGVIQEDTILDEKNLPQVKMPNRDHVALAPEWKHGAPRLAGYP